MTLFIGVLKECRIEHWIKNLLIFLPPFFVNKLFDEIVVEGCIPAFLSFSLVASSIYYINDIFDRKRDLEHNAKCNRPIASGIIPMWLAWAMAGFMAIIGLVLSCMAHARWFALSTLTLYLVMNVWYGVYLKHVAIVDVFVLALGFVFRVFYGGFYFSISISSWLFLCVFTGALYFALGKRRGELKEYGQGSSSRPVLCQYSKEFLDAHYYCCCGLTIVFYCLWTIARTDQNSVGKLALAIPAMVFIMFRYNYIVEGRGCDGDPVPVLLHDKWLMISVVVFFVINFVVLYFGQSLPRVQY